MRIGTKEENVQAYTEVACLLKYFPVPYIKKLPNKLLEMIYKNSDEKYIIDVDLKKGLNNQDISDKTKKILAVLTFNYWSNEAQKQNIKNSYMRMRMHIKKLYLKNMVLKTYLKIIKLIL